MRRRDVLAGMAAVSAFGLASGPRLANAQAWPSREITLIAPFPPGAGSDLTTRAVAHGMQKRLNTPVVVKNITGAGGAVGLSQLAGSKPDGYTLGLIGVTSFIVLPRTMGLNFNPWEALETVAQVADLRYGVGVGVSSPVKSVDDLVALSKKRRVTYSAGGPGNVIAMFQLAKLTSGNFRWVPFNGGVESVTQAAGGHVDAVIQSVSEMRPQIDAGSLRLIASAAADRWPEYPDVRTLRESGYDALSPGPFGYAVPAGTDPAIRARMEAVLSDTMADAEVRQQVTALGVAPVYRNGAEFRKLLAAIEADMVPILEETGMAKRK